VVDAITGADLVIVPPSNPIVSVGTILGVPGIREVLRATPAPVVGIPPIIGRHHVRGMAEQMLKSQGVEVSAAGVGLHYGARSGGGVLDGWLIADSDAGELSRFEGTGLRVAAAPLLMNSVEATTAMAATAIGLVHPC
jgi:LPPG:FO 2-phospho-L-lactate transferase